MERLFSQGRYLLVFTRNRLSGATIRKFLCLGAWSRHDLICTELLVKATNKSMSTRGEMKRAISVVDVDDNDQQEGPSTKTSRE